MASSRSRQLAASFSLNVGPRTKRSRSPAEASSPFSPSEGPCPPMAIAITAKAATASCQEMLPATASPTNRNAATATAQRRLRRRLRNPRRPARKGSIFVVSADRYRVSHRGSVMGAHIASIRSMGSTLTAHPPDRLGVYGFQSEAPPRAMSAIRLPDKQHLCDSSSAPRGAFAFH